MLALVDVTAIELPPLNILSAASSECEHSVDICLSLFLHPGAKERKPCFGLTELKLAKLHMKEKIVVPPFPKLERR